MITIKIIGILIVGIVFTLLGFSVCKFYKWKSVKGYLFLLLGLILLYIPTLGPLSKSYQLIEEIQKIDSNKVESIILKPTENPNRKNISLIKVDKIITDRKVITEICNSFRKSENAEDSYMKNPEKVCRIQINMANQLKKELSLKFSGQITCISVSSNGESGWHYGNLKSEDLQNKIIRIIK